MGEGADGMQEVWGIQKYEGYKGYKNFSNG